MSDTAGRPDWSRMKPADFGVKAKPAQDALFHVDEQDASGTDALNGLGYGATLWADQAEKHTCSPLGKALKARDIRCSREATALR
ncbi:hypothetical protein [Streptomyces sp. NPDC056821]|uniref:hypothetical protein n=1 Tax=unclassified Streptomyces TaxID=2593676 RepID=UPI0036CA8C5D